VLLAVIAACEIGFWVVLAAGLVTRYLLRLRKPGLVLLAAAPLVDVVLLVASVIDIKRGGELNVNHSLAAIFIGVSVGFGHQTLQWADKWAAHYLGGGPRPVKPPKGGPERARRERAGWYRHLLAYVIGVVIMIGLGLLSGDGWNAALGPAYGWTMILGIDAIVSFSYSIHSGESAEKTKQSV
jgi:hypothetical protein